MYQATVTVFNFYKSPSAALWFPHVLHGVDIVTDKGQMLRQYGPDSTDAAELHIAYKEMDNQKIIVHGWTGEPALNTLGEPLPWLPPKEWARQVNDMLDDTITFDSREDFFWLGAWEGGPVNDADYQDRRGDGFREYMTNNYDYVFKITSVGGPYTVIPHFEIRGA